MNVQIHRGLYVSIAQLDRGPKPLPLESGFSTGLLYLVVGGFTMSESSEMFLMLSNDRDEIWFISNRHVRTAMMVPGAYVLRLTREGTTAT